MNVYIVDDDRDLVKSLTAILAENGHAPTGYATASAFLEAAPALSPGCVLLDLMLPDLNGLEVQARLLDIADHAVVLLTGHGAVPDAVAAMRAGAVDFLGKPFRLKALKEALARAQEKVLAIRQAGEHRASLGAAAASLSAREIDVLKALAEGNPSKVVAHELGLSVRTIDMHRARIIRKLGVANIASALLIAREAGVI